MYLPYVSWMDWITGSAVCAALWSIVCRVNSLRSGRTKTGVFVQHVVLALGLLGGVLLQPDAAKASMASAVAIYLLIGSKRWRHGAPEGTNKPKGLEPINIPPDVLGKVWGRGRD